MTTLVITMLVISVIILLVTLNINITTTLTVMSLMTSMVKLMMTLLVALDTNNNFKNDTMALIITYMQTNDQETVKVPGESNTPPGTIYCKV